VLARKLGHAQPFGMQFAVAERKVGVARQVLGIHGVGIGEAVPVVEGAEAGAAGRGVKVSGSVARPAAASPVGK
jgi:hypothetical protein